MTTNILVGRKAPDFCTSAVLGTGEIVSKYRLYDVVENKYCLIFFYPLDFTFVCPSELIALDNRFDEFQQRGVEVIAVSIDSQFTHNAWRNTPVERGGIGPVRYTMVADINHSVCQAYGVEHPEANVALRGAFIIDRDNVVRAQIVNDLPLGRNMGELIRLVDALQFHEEYGEVCPANWNKGKAAIKASPEGIAKFLAENAEEL
jgi:peroxiredoxin (alkyl hydroperoxide reductase subunit C)